MNRQHVKLVLFIFVLTVVSLAIVNAINVFLLAFAAVLLAILLHSIGKGTKKITRLPYPLALVAAIVFITGVLTLIFWLYSPIIAVQFQALVDQLPDSISSIQSSLAPYFGNAFFSQAELQKEFALTSQKLLSQVVTIFSFTIGSIVSFIIFLIVGLYLALDPGRYVRGVLFTLSEKTEERVWEIMQKIARSLRWWLLGKFLSMVVIGILTFFGLWIMGVSLAFILGLLMGLLTFIPYVGPLLATIPAILVAFAQNPLLAVYVAILYLAIHAAEGYIITPFIEQKTVSIPPAVTIMSQVLLVVLIGGLGLALATPLVVVCIALAQYTNEHREVQTEIVA